MQDRFEYLKEHFLPRFWDSDGGGMILPELENGEITYVYWESQIDDWACCGYTLEDLLSNPRFIPMKPCGGLKDKHGTLMYENDECKCYNWWSGINGDTSQTVTGTIVWNSKTCSFDFRVLGYTDHYGNLRAEVRCSVTHNREFEIIGNIHQKGDSDE